MRIEVLSAVAALLLASVSWASGQTQTPPSSDILHPTNPAVFGQIDFGGRFTGVTGEEARYQRYRDLREGVFIEMPMYHHETDRWWMSLAVRNTGYRDQRYSLTAARPGRLNVRVFYDQTPTFISAETRTPYTPSPQNNGFYDNFTGTLSLPDTAQNTLQNDLTLAREQIENLAMGFPSRIRRDSLGFDLTFNFNEAWRTKVKYLNTKKEGNIPWGASFGFSLPIEIPLPIDNRTNDVGALLEWTNTRGMFRVGYDGSWFDQRVPVYTWDNPLRITDQTYESAYRTGDGTSIGRGTQWPSNSLSYVNLGGAYRFASRTSVNGTLSIGQAIQNEALVPYTINTAIPTLSDLSSLDRRTAEAKADIGAATVNVVTRPSRNFDVTARYRFSRYDNKTPGFERHEYVRLDQVREEGSSPVFHGSTRNYLDIDGAYRGLRYTTLRVGYGFSGADFAERIYLKSGDSTFRGSVDTVGNQYVSFRSLYEHAQRRGNGFRASVLDEAGEKPGMRHYDVSDRDRDRVTFVTNLMPSGDVGVNVSLAWTKDTYLNPEQPAESRLGLQDYTSRTYGIGIDYVPRESVGVGASYNYDGYSGLSRSSRSFDDPNLSWTTDENQRAHSFIASLDLLKLIQNTEARFSYDYSTYKGTYLYTTGPGYSPTPTAPGRVAQLPEVTANESRFAADLRYFIRRNVAVGFAYWYDSYKVSDFALGPPEETFVSGIARPPIDESQPVNSPINGIVLNYLYRPYTSHTAWVRLTYLW